MRIPPLSWPSLLNDAWPRSKPRNIRFRGREVFLIFDGGEAHYPPEDSRLRIIVPSVVPAFEHPVQQIAFQDYVDAVIDAEHRLKRIGEQIFGLLPEWTLLPIVDALQAMRESR